MNRYHLFLLFTIFFSLASAAQKLNVEVKYVTDDGNGSKNANIIYYQPGQLLKWDDFHAKPVEASDAAAITNAGFGLKLAFRKMENNAQLLINVNSSFSKKDSWVKTNYKTDYILNHEQKHFDIAFIHTVFFIKKLRNANCTNANYAAVIEKIYTETAEEMSMMQNAYDRETNHSRLKEKQAEWDVKITSQLAQALKEGKL